MISNLLSLASSFFLSVIFEVLYHTVVDISNLVRPSVIFVFLNKNKIVNHISQVECQCTVHKQLISDLSFCNP